MANIVIIIFLSFLAGLSVGVTVSRFTTEKKERDFLQRMEILGFRNNDILNDLKDVISFNNKLADRNRELEEQLTKFINDWT